MALCKLDGIILLSIERDTRHGTKRADRSINREMATLCHIFAKAIEWEMIEQNPLDKGKSLLLKINNQRSRYLNEEKVVRLLEKCKSNEHLYHIVTCAINTGLRKGDILNL
jgi:integrase